ncbi:hypothetical protein AB0E88_23065 [Streptomyces sp. NPDC028635]|uniref:hypothetical protein n=1 Tax=Streptomyces sp. NPDC028635 TaxID=3154800 RepID=UPI0033E3B567
MLAAVATLAATLTACGPDGPSQGKAERNRSTASAQVSAPPDCGPNSNLSQSEWMEQCSGSATASDTADKQPDTELAIGDTFAYTDGLKVTVDSIKLVTRYGEFDERPDADHTPFRVTFTITNGTSKPYTLDGLGYQAQGATTGGDTEPAFVEAGSKQMAGRLAPGRSGTFTAEYTIAKNDGKDIVFTVTRTDDAWIKNGSFLAEDPHWTGTIR